MRIKLLRMMRLFVVGFTLMLSFVACGGPSEQRKAMEEAGLVEPARGSPEAAAEAAFETWAQRAGTPYRNTRYYVIHNDGTFATLRIRAEFRETREEPWLEHNAEVECKKVGKQWQCESWMYFQLTQKGQQEAGAATATTWAVHAAAATAAPLATASAEVEATATAELMRAKLSTELKGAGSIAFRSDCDGNWEIYLVTADGSSLHNITNNPAASDFFSDWSPDGQRIAFYSYQDGNWEIYVMNADGSNRCRLTNSPAEDTSPAWSPDGQRLAFESNRDGNEEIYVVNADGSNMRNLTVNAAWDIAPPGWSPHGLWSPDGQSIAFHSGRDGNNEIYVMDAEGKNPRNITNNPASDWAPVWSPDGHRIAFTSDRDGNWEIYVVDATGSNLRRLTYNLVDDQGPTWSPDGQKIAFDSGLGEICVMDADGSNQLNLTNNPAYDHSPAWSPDGRWIAFVSNRDGNSEIYVMDVDSGNVLRLTNNRADDEGPAWSP